MVRADGRAAAAEMGVELEGASVRLQKAETELKEQLALNASKLSENHETADKLRKVDFEQDLIALLRSNFENEAGPYRLRPSALMYNQWVEQAISQQPEQYMWVHRRFKTRPEGESRPYAKRRRRKRSGSPPSYAMSLRR